MCVTPEESDYRRRWTNQSREQIQLFPLVELSLSLAALIFDLCPYCLLRAWPLIGLEHNDLIIRALKLGSSSLRVNEGDDVEG